MTTSTENLWETEATIVRLSQHPFLRGLNRTQLALLADCALSARFEPGQVIFQEGEKADRFYLLERGKVVLESRLDGGDAVIIDTISGGDLLGWSWMMPPYVWHFTARAAEPTEAIYFAGDILHDYCHRDHSLGFELHKRMSAVMMKRLQAARKKMLAIHSGQRLEPSIGLSPFMEQEFDTLPGEPTAPEITEREPRTHEVGGS